MSPGGRAREEKDCLQNMRHTIPIPLVVPVVFV